MITGLVSVIIVSFNNWPDLELAVESALQQSYHPVEIIVVDNGSIDETAAEIAQRFGRLVRFVRQPNLGDAGAYNTGIRLGAGEFLQFIDGDDFLAPNKIKKQVTVLLADPEVDIVYGDVRCFQTLAGVPGWTDWDTKEYEDILDVLVSPDGNGAGLMAHSALFRRTVFERVGLWDQTLYVADQDYWLRAAWAGCRFKYCAGSLCFHRKRPGQMSADVVACMRGIEEVWSKALGYISGESYRAKLAARLARLRFYEAVSQIDIDRDAALSKLALARTTDEEAIPPLAYVIGRLLITFPGGRHLARAKWLRPARRRIARLLGLMLPPPR